MGKATAGQASIHIDAPADTVYGLISDLPRTGEWSPECYRCEWVSGNDSDEGAEFKGYNRVGPMRWTAKGRVTAAVHGREFAFVTLHRGRREETRWRYLLDARDGGTDVTESYEFIWAPWYIRVADVFLPRDRQLRAGMRTTLERVKSVAEQVTHG
jgi:Polyketide cyclase / dehydrase and lipid transport